MTNHAKALPTLHPVHPHQPSDNEELAEQSRCFQCGTLLESAERSVAVTEGITLCDTCSRARVEGARTDVDAQTLPDWFDDLAGEEGPPHA